MSIGIIISDRAIPTIIEETSADKLLKAIKDLKITPDHINTKEDVKKWLSELPQPSGWYADRDAAKRAAQRAANHQKLSPIETVDVAELVKETRAILGMSRVEFGRKLGFNGNKNTVNKTIYDLEQRKSKLRPEKIEILNGIRANIELDEPGSFAQQAMASPPQQSRELV